MDELINGIISEETKEILIVAMADEPAALELIQIIEDAFIEEDPIFEDDGLKKDGSVPMEADFDLNGYKIINLADPTSAQDAATMSWVGAQITAISHSDLNDLGADDHPHYLLVSGTRAMSGNLNLASNNLNNVSTLNINNGVSTATASLLALGDNSGIGLQHTNAGDNAFQLFSSTNDETDYNVLYVHAGNGKYVQLGYADDIGAYFLAVDETAPKAIRLTAKGGVASEQLTLETDGSIGAFGNINFDANSYSIAIADESTADAATAPHLTLKASNKIGIASIGNGGNIVLQPGTSVGGNKGFVDATSSLISNVLNPISAQDVVTLSYFNANVTTDHTELSNIGINTHAQIDTHLADATLHFTEASIDHGSIAGLADDDHTQYVLADGTRDITGAINIDGLDIVGPTSGPADSVLIGDSLPSVTGAANTLIGSRFVAQGLTTGGSNVVIGRDAGRGLTGAATSNTIVGTRSLGASLTGTNNTLLGFDVSSNAGASGHGLGGTSSGNTLLGARAGTNLDPTTTTTNSVVIGFGAMGSAGTQQANTNMIVVGAGAASRTQVPNSIIIGNTSVDTDSVNSSVIALGQSSVFSNSAGVSNEMVVGSATYPINNFYFGEGGRSSTPSAIKFANTNAEGTDIAGGDFTVAAGAGTGTGAGGHLKFQTAPASTTGSTINTLVTRMEIGDDGIIDFKSNALSSVADPTAAQDVATKNYVDTNLVTDHGALSGLADDDHTQYVLADGTRDITGAIVIDGAKFSQSSTIGNKCLFIGENPVSATGNDSTGIGIGSLLSLTTGPGNTAIGVSAGYSITTGSFNLLVGQNAGALGLSNGFGNIGVGAGALQQAGANSQKLVAIGNVSGLQATGSRALYIGASAGFQCTGSNNIVLTGEGNAGDFRGLTSLAASNEFSVGSAISPIIDAYFGEGAVSASPGNISFNGTGGNGTDISAGAFVDLNGGRGTGTGTGSAVRIRTAPAGATGSTRNTLVTRMEIADTGKVDFSSAAPVGLPRLTTTERDVLTAVNGDVIYNTTDNKFQGYESGAWANLI